MGSAAFILSGVVMLGATGFVIYLARPREGKPAFFLARSDTGSSFLAIALILVAIFGIGLVVKGVMP